MLFMFWTHPEMAEPTSAPAWRALYPDFRVFGDDDVRPLLPMDIERIYDRIRLPSAKSDLARLLLLKHHGGLYLDAHVGPGAPEHLLETILPLSRYNLILFGKGWAMKTESDFDLMNGIIAARRGALELDVVINRLLSNLFIQWIKERGNPEYVPYGLFGLTGTYTLIQSFFDQQQPRPRIKDQYRDTVMVHYMQDNKRSGFELAAHYNYRRAGAHWSEREKNERFYLE